ncbi:MAG: hypothetical protein ACLQQ4_12520 [Bacteroidia bacterium]
MTSTKKYLSLFLLVLFLFPQVEKGIHVFQHHRESEPSVENVLHFNHAEHPCPICDYSFAIPHQAAPCKCDVYVFVKSADYATYFAAVPFIDIDGQFSPRAPPIV